MAKKKSLELRSFVLASILCALIVVMTVTPYTGYISYGLIEITTLHILVILGAVLLGWKYGALLGLVWGVTCLIRAYAMPIFLPFGFGNPLVSVLPRVLVGVVAGLLSERLLKTRLRKTVSLAISTVAATLTNTVLVLSAMSIYCRNTFADTLTSILQTLVGVNGTIELLAAILIIPPIYFALRPRETVLGVDFGASTTKLAVVQNGRCLRALRKEDNETLEEAMERIDITGVKRVAITGVGASYINGDVHGLPTVRKDEFSSLCAGVMSVAKKKNCLIVSVGTGTSFVRVTPIRAWHVGGTGIGGGMLRGLSEALCGVKDLDELTALADKGTIGNVDLVLSDVCAGTISNLTPDTTVANLSKLAGVSKEDAALGILNLTFQAIGVMAAFAVKKHFTRTIVVVGTITDIPIAETILAGEAKLHNVTFIIPDHAAFITAIGAARD